MNRIGDEGAREIFSVLADNKHLESLSVSANGLTGECKQELRLLIEVRSRSHVLAQPFFIGLRIRMQNAFFTRRFTPILIGITCSIR